MVQDKYSSGEPRDETKALAASSYNGFSKGKQVPNGGAMNIKTPSIVCSIRSNLNRTYTFGLFCWWLWNEDHRPADHLFSSPRRN